MKEFKRTTVTSALPYANGPVHIGHLAGVYVPADIYVRYLRLKGEEVLFIGGSDEHGVPITIKAKKEGVTPQDIVDRYHTIIKKSFEDFGISFDVYSRTTSTTHKELASDIFKTIYEKGGFIEQSSEQCYDEKAQQFHIKTVCSDYTPVFLRLRRYEFYQRLSDRKFGCNLKTDSETFVYCKIGVFFF